MEGILAMETQSVKPISNLAVWSLILGIASLVFCCLPAAIPAIICGHLARSKARQAPDTLSGNGMALAGLITGYVSVVAFILACIMGVIAAITLPSVIRLFRDEQKTERIENLRAIETTTATLFRVFSGQQMQWQANQQGGKS